MLVTMRTIDYRHILSKFLMDKMQLKVRSLSNVVLHREDAMLVPNKIRHGTSREKTGHRRRARVLAE